MRNQFTRNKLILRYCTCPSHFKDELGGIRHTIQNDMEGYNIELIIILSFILVVSKLKFPITLAEEASRNMGARVQKHYRKNGND